jgi:hypothetical protein
VASRRFPSTHQSENVSSFDIYFLQDSFNARKSLKHCIVPSAKRILRTYPRNCLWAKTGRTIYTPDRYRSITEIGSVSIFLSGLRELPFPTLHLQGVNPRLGSDTVRRSTMVLRMLGGVERYLFGENLVLPCATLCYPERRPLRRPEENGDVTPGQR